VAALGAAVEVGALGRGSIDWAAVTDAHRFAVHHPGVVQASRVITDFGSPVVVDVLAAVTATLLWLRRRVGDALFVVTVRLVTMGADTLLKNAIRRPRPTLPHPLAHAFSFSFPSGHASGAASVYLPVVAVLATALPEFARRASVAAATLLCLAVAGSRVVLGLHYPSDVIAGLALGVMFTLLFVPLRTWRPDRKVATDARR
jgi:membrane-associated phospholipid phosphatase